MELQRLLSYTRKAVDTYDMIQEGDRIALGVSGGKDSLTLLYGLSGLARFYPRHFELTAVTVSLGFPGFDLEPVRELCARLGVRHETVETQIGPLVFEARQEERPCSLCSRLRKGALNQAVLDMGCNKVAYAHNREDLVETMLLSLFYEGRFHCFPPKTGLDRTGLTVIRPLMLTPEAEILGFRNKYRLPVVKNPCPADGHTRRAYVRDLLRRLNRENPGICQRMFTAIQSGSLPGWPEAPL